MMAHILYKEMEKTAMLCDRINVNILNNLLNEGLLTCLKAEDNYIIESRFNKGNSLMYIAYETGYRSASAVSTAIKRIVRKLVKEANKSIKILKEDPLRYILPSSLINKSYIACPDLTIDDYMVCCDLHPKNMNKADVLITLEILKHRLGYNPNMNVLIDLADHDIPVLDAYRILISDSEDDKHKFITGVYYSLSESFIINFKAALDIVYKNDPKMAGLIVALLPYGNRENLQKVSRKLLSKYFIDLIYEPKCLYTCDYFKYSGSEQIEVDSLITLPDSVIEKLQEYSRSIHGGLKLSHIIKWTYFDIERLKDIVGRDNDNIVIDTISDIVSVNNNIATDVHDICKKGDKK